MAVIESSRISVTTAATLLVSADSDGCRVYIHNPNATSVVLGNSSVTATTGMALDSAAGPKEFIIPPFGELYGIVSSVVITVQVLVFGNR